MSQKLQEHMCKYIQEQIEPLKGCLLAVLNSKEQYLNLLDESLGTPTPSMDLKLCEFLANAGLFREEIKLNRDGRNEYKLFFLTDVGKEIAMQIKKET